MKDYLKAGDYFGERALLTKEKRGANIVVTSAKIRVLALDKDTFNKTLGSKVDVLKANMQTYAKSREEAADDYIKAVKLYLGEQPSFNALISR